jgi:hypothetical protein
MSDRPPLTTRNDQRMGTMDLPLKSEGFENAVTPP